MGAVTLEKFRGEGFEPHLHPPTLQPLRTNPWKIGEAAALHIYNVTTGTTVKHPIYMYTYNPKCTLTVTPSIGVDIIHIQ